MRMLWHNTATTTCPRTTTHALMLQLQQLRCRIVYWQWLQDVYCPPILPPGVIWCTVYCRISISTSNLPFSNHQAFVIEDDDLQPCGTHQQTHTGNLLPLLKHLLLCHKRPSGPQSQNTTRKRRSGPGNTSHHPACVCCIVCSLPPPFIHPQTCLAAGRRMNHGHPGKL